ncbi:redoxin family protein [Ochrobactrum grignonense]|nr:redoxin family protein [Brucella grignonensis]
MFAVPGAFTPTCSLNHLPGYLENRDTILAKGVDQIAVVAVNDAFVMSAWAQSTGGEGKILYLADGSALLPKLLVLNWMQPQAVLASARSVIRLSLKTVSSKPSTSRNRLVRPLLQVLRH